MLAKIREKKERALGAKLFVKAERCSSPKCVMVRRPYRPGLHGQKRHSLSEYGRQLQEKQKLQIIYGLTNRQLRNLFKKRPEKIVSNLERRLDRALYYLGFAASPRIARQLIGHGHILVNDHKVTISSYRVGVGDIVKIKPASQSLKILEGLRERLKKYEPPVWLKMNADDLTGVCVAIPDAKEMNLPLDINLVGEFYSR